MMNVWYNVKRMGTKMLAVAVGIMTLCACDSAIYDYEGDCSINYKVRFKYDYNLKFADAFAHEVKTVTLYLFDTDGKLVWERTESGDILQSRDYAMTVDVAPGTYSMLAWCGAGDKKSFDIPNPRHITDLTCTLNRKRGDDGKAYYDEQMDHLYYGYVPAKEFIDYEGTYYDTIPLMKNTNSVRVVLQQMTDEPEDRPIDEHQFRFTITDNNGKMDWDNSVLPDEMIKYHAWHTKTGLADMGQPDDQPEGTEAKGTRKNGTFRAVVAELTIPRLMMDHKPYLTVTNTENNEVVFSIPLIDYLLLVKGEATDRREMGDQEYLDRQDEAAMTFFLDEGYRWINAYIYINSWHVVLNNAEL